MINATTQRKPVELPSDQTAAGRTLGEEEIANLTDAIRSGTLTSTKGTFVNELERRFAKLLEVENAYACSSGTAALHTAVAAVDPEPGDEIVTSPITDMGAITPILYQGAIPVFADVDPATCNLTAATIEPVLNKRTKAIVVTHLFGNPSPMTEIMDLARSRGIPVIEDCAQAFLAQCNGQLVGTIGDIGCFSLQQGKHITTGEGGLLVTNNPQLARRSFLFTNKAWGYGDPQPDHYFLALNYRMCELQGAVAVAQLDKLESSVRKRVTNAKRLTEKLQDLAEIRTPVVYPGNVHTYWKYCLRADESGPPGGVDALGKKLKEHGIASAPRYIQKPAFMCEVFVKQRTFGKSRFPFTLARPDAVDYAPSKFSGTFEALQTVLVLPWNERYSSEHVDYLAQRIRNAVEQLRESQ